MQILFILSLLSFAAIAFIFYKKISEINCQIKEGTHCGYAPNFFGEYLNVFKKKVNEVLDEINSYMKPHVQSIASFLTRYLYKLSSSVAQESLRLYNFVQGKRTLKNTGTTSLFLRDMAKHK